jgi:hypothetical protein
LRWITQIVNSKKKITGKVQMKDEDKKVQDNRHLEALLFTVTKS